MNQNSANGVQSLRPIPPEKPLPMECCETGCEVCVFDAYIAAWADYEKALASWLQENEGGGVADSNRQALDT